MAKGTPSPFQGRATVRLPPSKFFLFFQANFFIFFLPYPITSSIYPFFLSLRDFLFLCVYFPIRVSFRVSEGKKRLFLSYLYLCGYYAPYSHSLLCFSVVFFGCISLLFYSLCCVLALSFVVDAVFFADLPILLPSVGLSPLLCVIIRLGVFRGSEAKKNRFSCCCWVVYIRKKGGRDFLSAPSALYLWLVMPAVSFPVQE